jgi:DNA-binding protein HU-beta
MKKTELVNMLAKESKLEKKQVKALLDGLTTVVTKSLKKGDEVPLTGLGKFKVRKLKARKGINPRTGETIQIPARKKVAFTVAKALKDQITPQRGKKKK